MSTVVTGATLDACLDFVAAHPAPGVDAAFAARALQDLGRSPANRWVVLGPEGPVLVGVVVDTCDSRDNVADLLVLGGEPAALSAAQLDALLGAAERVGEDGPRDALEVALSEATASWAPTLAARGYVEAHASVTMRRPPGPVVEPPLPAGLWWEGPTPARMAAFHAVVGEAFAALPGAMVQPLEAFSAWALSARPPAALLMSGETLVGWVRVVCEPDRVELSSLGLAAAARGRGLGRVLVARGLAMAGPEQPVTLDVAAENDQATRLYLGFGFEEVERVPMLRRSLRSAGR